MESGLHYPRLKEDRAVEWFVEDLKQAAIPLVRDPIGLRQGPTQVDAIKTYMDRRADSLHKTKAPGWLYRLAIAQRSLVFRLIATFEKIEKSVARYNKESRKEVAEEVFERQFLFRNLWFEYNRSYDPAPSLEYALSVRRVDDTGEVDLSKLIPYSVQYSAWASSFTL